MTISKGGKRRNGLHLTFAHQHCTELAQFKRGWILTPAPPPDKIILYNVQITPEVRLDLFGLHYDHSGTQNIWFVWSRSLDHHIVEIRGDVADAGQPTNQTLKIESGG